MAHPRNGAALWKTGVSHLTAVLVAILLVVAGVWKITDPFNAAARLAQARVPASLSLWAACLLGVAETYAGVLIFVPRFRRWGAWLGGALLLSFMIYIGIYYNVLRGEECNCFPWVKRAVGPAFFVGDAAMLALAAIAGWWARPSGSRRSAVLVLLAVSVFAAVSYGVTARLQASIVAPLLINVDGKPLPLRQGRVFLYFFDPECTHCDAAARAMASLNWAADVKIIGIPTEQPRFAQDFMRSTGLGGSISYDVSGLRNAFHFAATPYAVALESGRLKDAFSRFDQQEPEASLRRLAFVR